MLKNIAVVAAFLVLIVLAFAVWGTCYSEQRDMGASVIGAVGACG